MAIRNKDGHWMDGKGDFVPVRYIQKLDKKRDQVVTKLVTKAEKLNKQLEKLKEEAFQEIEKYIETAKDFYGVNISTQQGNKTLTDFANSLKVELSVKKKLAFDEKLEFAKGLIDECISVWSEGANTKLIMLVEQAFKTNKQGMIDRDRILGLLKLNIKDARWNKAMEIISDSLTVVDKKSYIRFQKKVDDRWKTIYLDISKIN